ncbi:AMP-binding protein [Catellatospora coxensis]
MGDRTYDPADNYAAKALTLFAGFGDAEALVAVDGRRYSYAEVHGEVIAMAGALWAHGVRPGQALGVLARNPAESIFLQLAAGLMGCRTAWIANNAPPRFRRGFLDLAEVDAFVYDAGKLPEMGAELAALAAPRPVFCFGSGGKGRTSPPGRPRSRCRSIRPASPTSRRRCSRPAAPPARRSWCTTATASSPRCTPCRSTTCTAASPPCATC